MKWHIGLRSKQRSSIPPSPDRIITAPSLPSALLQALAWAAMQPLDDMTNLVVTIERTDDDKAE